MIIFQIQLANSILVSSLRCWLNGKAHCNCKVGNRHDDNYPLCLMFENSSYHHIAHCKGDADIFTKLLDFSLLRNQEDQVWLGKTPQMGCYNHSNHSLLPRGLADRRRPTGRWERMNTPENSTITPSTFILLHSSLDRNYWMGWMYTWHMMYIYRTK